MSSPLTELIVELVASGRISAAQLQQALDGCAALPRRTHAEHYRRALAQCPAPSLSTYKTNFGRLAERFGQTPLDAVTTADLEELARDVSSQCVTGGGLGVGAQSSFIHAARFFYRVAVTDGVLATNPAAGLVMPRRRRRVRRALVEAELADIYRVVTDSSQDPVLDLLLLDFHRETAARRGGAIGLQVADLNPARGSALLREKGDNEREVPVSADLMDRILRLADERAAPGRVGRAFRYRNGLPLSRRRYNTIFQHVQRRLTWAGRLGVSIHWFRHTTLSDVAAVAGIRVAAAYAGHLDRSVTDIYTVPTFEDLQAAHAAIFR